MASAIYPKAKEAFLSGSIDMTSDTIKAVLVDTGTYTYSAAHDFLDDLSGTVGTAITLDNKTVTNGVFDVSDNTDTFTSVSGNSVEAIVIYKDTGVAGTSPLIAYIDGISVTPNGGDIVVDWDDGASGIFAL